MTHLVYEIDIAPFLKACTTFERFRKNLTTDQEQAGAIQAFEFSYELAWKTMKRLLRAKGIDARSPCDCFREAAAVGMIKNPAEWFVFLEKRNLMLDAEEESELHQTINVFENFSRALSEFRQNLN